MEQAKILIVDDQEVNRFALNEFVETLGHLCFEAENGRDALEKVKSLKPDLILLDIMMPGIGGQEVLHALKQDREFRNVPVIMISALDDMEKVRWCIEEGALDYLVKPFDTILLRARINAGLVSKRESDTETRYRRRLEESNRLLMEEIEKRTQMEGVLKKSREIALRHAHAAGMAELAGSVLHNIGNTLNSINICSQGLRGLLEHSYP